MASRQLAFATPPILKWARTQSGFSEADAADAANVRVERLVAAEVGTAQLTMRELERVAKTYRRSVAFFFLAEPPAEPPVEAQFRRLRDAPPPPWPPALRHVVREVRERQDDVIALLETLEVEPRWPGVHVNISADPEEMGASVRRLMGLADDQPSPLPMRSWIDAIEGLGVFVMQSGDVPLPITRGFASPDPLVPAIVLNTKDHWRARIFTALHELIHLLVPQSSDEGFFDAAAGAAFMPASAFEAAYRRALAEHGEPVAAADDVSRLFGATPRATVVRAWQRRLITSADMATAMEELDRRPHWQPGKGGNYYRNILTWRGPAFTGLVLTAFDAQVVNYTTAANMLDVKVTKFAGLRRALEERAALV